MQKVDYIKYMQLCENAVDEATGNRLNFEDMTIWEMNDARQALQSLVDSTKLLYDR